MSSSHAALYHTDRPTHDLTASAEGACMYASVCIMCVYVLRKKELVYQASAL